MSSRALFSGGETRRLFLALLNLTYERYSLSVVAYCLLSTHYHLLVKTTEDNLSRSLQWLNSRYAERINAEERGRGHLFGARFWSRRILSDADLLATTRYIALNPVKAGICRSAEEWPWSSYSVLVRGLRRPALRSARAHAKARARAEVSPRALLRSAQGLEREGRSP